MGTSDQKLCVVCSRVFRADLTTCPDDGADLVTSGDTSASRVGEVIGNYRLLRVVGEGGAGTVYEAEHIRLGRKMAIKLLHRDAVNKEIALRFFNEARAVNEIHHPNIIDVEDFVTTPAGEHYMVMELLVGEDVRTAISSGSRLTPERVAAIGEQVASALGAVHRVGILHRDLKPDNIFLINRDGAEVAKLLDFGIAKFTDEGGVTRAGMTMGTPQYMAPERIITNAKVGAHADIYALGMVLYECLVGAPAFNSPTIANILRGHCFEAVVPPSQRLGAPLPPVLEAAIMKCLEKAPEHRFATADDLALALRSETPVELARSTIQRAATEPERPRGRSKQLAFAVLIASVALAVHLWPKEPELAAAAATPGEAVESVAAKPTETPTVAMEPVPVEPEPAEPVPVVEPAPVAAAVVEPPAPATISVGMSSKPAGATIFLGEDRTPLGKVPVTAKLPKSMEAVSLIARFPDGTEVTETIVPDRSRSSLVFEKPRTKTASKTTKATKADVKTTAPAQKVEKPNPNDRDGTLNPFNQ